MNGPALGRLNSVGSYGWSGAATTTFSVDPEEQLTYVILAQLMPNDTALMQRVETLIDQAISGVQCPLRQVTAQYDGGPHFQRGVDDATQLGGSGRLY